MGQDFFTYLPSEITIDILSRLPVRTTMSCKCVRRSWRSLIETLEFAKSYKSFTGLAVFQGRTSSDAYKFYELEDGLNREYSKNSCNLLFNFSFPHPYLIHKSVDGLLLLFDSRRPDDFVICNPVTREYIKLPSPPPVPVPECEHYLETFGFGVSKTTGQYKLVRIFREGYKSEGSHLWKLRDESQWQAYTLGTGLWRSIAPSGLLVNGCDMAGAFLNGNVHWLAYDLKGSLWISCFDLETELLSTFSPPPHLDALARADNTLSDLRDCLCLCDQSSEYELALWLMEEYGGEKSWTKQFLFAKPHNYCCDYMLPIKVFRDGDILIVRLGCSKMICYSNKTKTVQDTDLIESHNRDFTSAVCILQGFFLSKPSSQSRT